MLVNIKSSLREKSMFVLNIFLYLALYVSNIFILTSITYALRAVVAFILCLHFCLSNGREQYFS